LTPPARVSGWQHLGDRHAWSGLCQFAQCFYSPNAGGDSPWVVLRGATETMLLCEAAGFDTILVEKCWGRTSEIGLRSMVDFSCCFLLLARAMNYRYQEGHHRDGRLVLINKADGDNRLRARARPR